MLSSSSVATIFFAVFSLYFIHKKSFIVSAICLIAFTNYAAMSMSIGKIVQPTGTYDYAPRYMDWAMTTPLLLLTVLLRCHHQIPSLDVYVLFLVLDVLMVYAGYLGIRTRDTKTRNAMFSIGCVFYLMIFALLWTYKPPRRLFFFLLMAWMVYPIVWILHETEHMTNENYNQGVAVLDIVSKIGYGFILA